MNNRIKQVRDELNLTQKEFSEKIGFAQTSYSQIEKGVRNVNERIIKLVCQEFNVNEEWLRTGEGDIFTDSSDFSIDELIRRNNLSELKVDIIKAFIELDNDVCEKVLAHFKKTFYKHDVINKKDTEFADDNYIDHEVERYRQELEFEKNMKTLSASGDIKKDVG